MLNWFVLKQHKQRTPKLYTSTPTYTDHYKGMPFLAKSPLHPNTFLEKQSQPR
jgi:hypothetical protein